MEEKPFSSRIPGWHRFSPVERGASVADWLLAPAPELLEQLHGGGLSIQAADQLIENVVGLHALPFALAPNFVINHEEYLVPMVIEEPSVVAAAANAARIARAVGGFSVSATDPVMICQVQLFVDDHERARVAILDAKKDLLARAAAADPTLAELGGGPTGLEVRYLDDPELGNGFLVVHLHVCVLDAMGANSVNTMGEALVPRLEAITGGRAGLRILSNLADQRVIKATLGLPARVLAMKDFSGERVLEGIVSASRFAELDPYRAATHNKGIMNGVDAVLLATGNDWRAVEAGAHAFASRDGRYRPLCVWRRGSGGELEGELRMPMAVGVVGGATRVHRGARLAMQILKVSTATGLACVAGAVGMANNLAALRALATEGIQKGHMRLHHRSRNLASTAGPENPEKGSQV